MNWRARRKRTTATVMIDYLTYHGQTLLVDLLRLCLWLAILSIIFVPLERLFALHPRRVFRPGIGADVGYFFLSGLLPAMLLSMPVGAVAWGVHRLVPHGFLVAVAGMPFWFRIVAGLMVGDIGYYWAHRCMHAVPLLWRFHAVHHGAPQIDFLVNTHAHPIDLVFGRLCGVIPLYVLGLAGPVGTGASTAPLLIVLIGTIWGFFIHANLRWRLGPLEWVISTPHFHHWHHTIDAPFSQNYAAMLPWLDRLFGTYFLPAARWPARYGIDEAGPESMGEQLLQPFLERRPSTVV
jgi:sterol desaturase/sphingolipid hydroxylase (fatty acid hydroxylase superfamily)